MSTKVGRKQLAIAGSRLRLYYIILALALVITSGSLVNQAFATTWDYQLDYNVVIPQIGQGSGNAWFYKMADPSDRGGIYPDMGIIHSSCYSNWGPNAFHLACPTFVHPGTFNGGELTPDVVIGFRAPNTGVYHVEGFFADIDGSDSVFGSPELHAGVCTDITTTSTPGIPNSDVNIPQFTTKCMDASNKNEVMRTKLGGVNPLPTSAAFNFDIALNANQFLNFRVNDFGSNRFDTTALSIKINAPTPSGSVGGEIIPVDMTPLLVAGAFTNAFWMIPTLGGIAGAAIAIFKIKRKLE